MSILLDTTVLIDVLRGRDYLFPRLAGIRGDFLTSAVNVHEVWAGLREEHRPAAEALVESLIVLPVGRAEATLSGDWRREYAARGIALDPPDTLIAACAVTRGVPLATANVKDFPMPELQVEHWSSI